MDEPTIEQLNFMINQTLISLSFCRNEKNRKAKLERLDILQKMYNEKVAEEFGIENN